jgi:hypothetical protein
MSNTEADIEFIRKNQYLTSFAYQIPASELLDRYWHAGTIGFSSYLGMGDSTPDPYRDKGANHLYSDTIAALLLGLPFPKPIVAENLGRGRLTIVSGERTLGTIIHYLGGMPNVKRTLSDDVNVFPRLSDVEFSKLSEDQKEELLRGVHVNIIKLDPHASDIDHASIVDFYGTHNN